jgi:hypothetical protein
MFSPETSSFFQTTWRDVPDCNLLLIGSSFGLLFGPENFKGLSPKRRSPFELHSVIADKRNVQLPPVYETPLPEPTSELYRPSSRRL